MIRSGGIAMCVCVTIALSTFGPADTTLQAAATPSDFDVLPSLVAGAPWTTATIIHTQSVQDALFIEGDVVLLSDGPLAMDGSITMVGPGELWLISYGNMTISGDIKGFNRPAVVLGSMAQSPPDETPDDLPDPGPADALLMRYVDAILAEDLQEVHDLLMAIADGPWTAPQLAWAGHTGTTARALAKAPDGEDASDIHFVVASPNHVLEFAASADVTGGNGGPGMRSEANQDAVPIVEEISFVAGNGGDGASVYLTASTVVFWGTPITTGSGGDGGDSLADLPGLLQITAVGGAGGNAGQLVSLDPAIEMNGGTYYAVSEGGDGGEALADNSSEQPSDAPDGIDGQPGQPGGSGDTGKPGGFAKALGLNGGDGCPAGDGKPARAIGGTGGRGGDGGRGGKGANGTLLADSRDGAPGGDGGRGGEGGGAQATGGNGGNNSCRVFPCMSNVNCEGGAGGNANAQSGKGGAGGNAGDGGNGGNHCPHQTTYAPGGPPGDPAAGGFGTGVQNAIPGSGGNGDPPGPDGHQQVSSNLSGPVGENGVHGEGGSPHAGLAAVFACASV